MKLKIHSENKILLKKEFYMVAEKCKILSSAKKVFQAQKKSFERKKNV